MPKKQNNCVSQCNALPHIDVMYSNARVIIKFMCVRINFLYVESFKYENQKVVFLTIVMVFICDHGPKCV